MALQSECQQWLASRPGLTADDIQLFAMLLPANGVLAVADVLALSADDLHEMKVDAAPRNRLAAAIAQEKLHPTAPPSASASASAAPTANAPAASAVVAPPPPQSHPPSAIPTPMRQPYAFPPPATGGAAPSPSPFPTLNPNDNAALQRIGAKAGALAAGGKFK